MRTNNTIREYRLRKWKRSVPGQIFRGTFFALAYGPAIAAYKTATFALKIIGYTLAGIFFIARWAVWPKSENAVQVLAAPVALVAVATAAYA